MGAELSPKIIRPAAPDLISARSPSVAGRFAATPKGFLLHGSRSGIKRSIRAEFSGTVAYALGGADGLGWHATIGEGIIAEHMKSTEWGWNAYEASKEYIAVEFAQARLGDEITDAQVAAFCWYALERVRPAWPEIPLFLINHSELQPEKSDAYPRGPEAAAFRERVAAALAKW